MPLPPPPPQRIAVYEYLTAGGGLPALSPAEEADLRNQGRAMHDAMLADLSALPGLTTVACGPTTGAPADTLAALARAGWIVWAVAPESDATLERLAAAVPPACWFGCDRRSIALAASKQATVSHLAAHGIPVPNAAAWPAAQAWIVKPDDGAGATDTRRHATRAAAEADLAGRTAPSTLEPWIEGEPLSLSLACGPGGTELLAINRQQLRVDADGTLHFLGVVPAAVPPGSALGRTFAPLVPALARALPGLRGYVGVDLVLTPQGRAVVIEVNPRLTSAYVGLSARLGFNVAERLLAVAGIRPAPVCSPP